MTGVDLQEVMENAAEACADALLTACAAVISARDSSITEFEVEHVLTVAGEMIDKVLSRTTYEGAKPE